MSENNQYKITKFDILNAIVLSGVLGSSKNQIALFKFLLEHKFGSSDVNIKTKDIAIEVFGRDDSFSAKHDSIVRVEMFRLRANLDIFNQQSDDLKVTLPKSSYKLDVKSLPLANVLPPTDKGHIDKPNRNPFYAAGFAVLAAAVILSATTFNGVFKSEPKGTECSKMIPNLEVAQSADNKSELDEYVHQVISGAASQFTQFNLVQDVKSCASSGVPGYKLQYALLQSDADFQGSLSVISQQNAKVIGVDNFFGVSMSDVSDPNLGREDLYFTIVKITNDLLKPAGVVHRNAVSQTWKDEVLFEDYSCIIKMHVSFVLDSDDDYYEALECLDGAYKNGTTSLDNLGALAASYLEQAQGNRGVNGTEPLMRAKVILDDIGDRWLQSSESTTAKIMYDAIRDDYNEQRLRKTLLRAEKTYTSHPLVMLEISRYSGFILGDWDLAITLNHKVRRLTSDKDNSVYLVDAAYAVLEEKSPEAWANCVKVYSEYSKVSNLLVHACAVKYEKTVWEARTAENLMKFNLLQLTERRAFIESMGFEPLLSEALLAASKSNLYD